MKIRDGFIVRQVGEKKYAVATGDALNYFKGMISLNDTGARIFELLKNDTTESEVVKKIMEEYDVEEDVVKTDVSNFVDTLKISNILE